jgi:hypothetical protein
MQIPAPAIVTAQHRGDHAAAGRRNKAELGIPLKKTPNRLPPVGNVEADTLGFLPEGIDLIVIGYAERTNTDR